MELDDVGKEIKYMAYSTEGNITTFKAKIGMIIKAPRGICCLFDRPFNQKDQGEAIKAFMEEHRSD